MSHTTNTQTIDDFVARHGNSIQWLVQSLEREHATYLRTFGAVPAEQPTLLHPVTHTESIELMPAPAGLLDPARSSHDLSNAVLRFLNYSNDALHLSVRANVGERRGVRSVLLTCTLTVADNVYSEGV